MCGHVPIKVGKISATMLVGHTLPAQSMRKGKGEALVLRTNHKWACKQIRHPDVFCALISGFPFVKVVAFFPTPADNQLPTVVVTDSKGGKLRRRVSFLTMSLRHHTNYNLKLNISVTKSLL